MIESIIALSPLLVVAVGAVLLMLAEALGKPADPEAVNAEGEVVDAGAGRASELALGATVILTLGALLSLFVGLMGPSAAAVAPVAPYLVLDGFAYFSFFTLCVGAALATLTAGGYLTEHRIDRSEFFVLTLLATAGAMALAVAGDLLALFIALETMSLGVYAMIALRRTPRAVEASLKYFLLGSFAAAVQLFGMALLYGATGRTDLVGIGAAIASATAATPAVSATVLLALALSLAGLAFKVSAVPFHMWTPDAYEGAPTPTTSFMAVAVKTAAFAVMLRMLLVAFGDPRLAGWATGWPPAVATLAVVTLFVAHLVAGRQESVKRMLAYSSVAHAGYVLIGVAAAARSEQLAVQGVLFYLLTYTVSTAGAFAALVYCGRHRAEAVSYEDLAGIGRRHPAAAAAFTLFLLSLAGMPPTAGFLGKLYVFQAAMDAGLYTLALLGLASSVLGAYYYLRVVVYMYMREPAKDAPIATPMGSGQVVAALVAAGLLVLVLGMWPGPALDLALVAGR